MRCTNKKIKVIATLFALSLFLSSCSNLKYDFAYDPNYGVSSFQVTGPKEAMVAEPFAQDLCIISEDKLIEGIDVEQAGAACLFDVASSEVLFSKNAHERLHPASLTKVMTALVALKKGTMDQLLIATDAVKITEPGAQLCKIKNGDSMTLDQALHILLMYSANDVANLIADNLGGSVEGFVELMNEEAARLGATNTHFSNPHGLTQDNHYTTAYDMYLIFNEAMKYEVFTQIMHMTSYDTVYKDANGNDKELSISTTNRYLKGEFAPPEKITVIGGKTGTTDAAGHCLILLSKDTTGKSYISIILRESSSDNLYDDMTDLLEEINK